MKKLLLAITLMLTAPAFAHGQGYGSPWVPFGVGVIVGNVLTQRPSYTYQTNPIIMMPNQPNTTVYVYPTNAGVIPMPGQVCELRSENINGQIVTNNYCWSR